MDIYFKYKGQLHELPVPEDCVLYKEINNQNKIFWPQSLGNDCFLIFPDDEIDNLIIDFLTKEVRKREYYTGDSAFERIHVFDGKTVKYCIHSSFSDAKREKIIDAILLEYVDDSKDEH